MANKSSQGIGFIGVLTITFIILKLIGKISWSWWLVLCPIWIGILIAVVFIFLVVLLPLLFLL